MEHVHAAAGLSQIDRWQKNRQKAFKAIPPEGRMIKYLGKQFMVYPGTFWPFTDSQPLVRQLQVEPGDAVLDVGTGSGVIAVHACYAGAGRVLALDVNPAALRSAAYNATLHGYDDVMEVRESNLFQNVGDEQFDVITANLPFRDKPAPDVVARSQWDTNFETNTGFFEQVGRYLKPGGRIYFAQANFGAIEQTQALAAANGYSVQALGSAAADKAETKKFFVFLIQRLAPVRPA